MGARIRGKIASRDSSEKLKKDRALAIYECYTRDPPVKKKTIEYQRNDRSIDMENK